MFIRLWRRLDAWERSLHGRFTHGIADPEERRQSARYVRWLDHGILRSFWTNHAEVAPGVWRSNHPGHERLSALAAEGFKTILNLRGGEGISHHAFEAESCAALGMRLVTIPMAARVAPQRTRLLELIAAMGTIEKPFLMHCKSGADRTGLAAAVYLMVYRGVPVAEAKKQLSPRFLHFRFSKTGILDHVLELYEARLAAGPIGFADWVATEYDQDAATAGIRGPARQVKGWLAFRLARLMRSEAGLARWSIRREAVLEELEGRRVALVGNARALAEGTAGAEIDGHDLVVRVNRAPMPSAASHGARADWLGLAVRLDAAALARLDPGLTLWMSHKRKRLPWAAVQRRFYLYPQEDIRRLWSELGSQPTTGAMLIDLLARSGAASVDLYGFDFFASLSLTGSRTAEKVPHDFAAEKAWVESLMARDGRVRLH